MHATYNKNLLDVLNLTQEMILLADRGDDERIDSSCGVLYGSLRDAAWKIRRLAEQEREQHIASGSWRENSPVISENTAQAD